mgnify:CR=1 FL=1
MTAAAASVKDLLGGDALYAIVNNAGCGLSHGVSAEEVFNTNLYGTKRVVDAFLPLLGPTAGRSVSVGSGAGAGASQTGPSAAGVRSPKTRLSVDSSTPASALRSASSGSAGGFLGPRLPPRLFRRPP